MRPFSFPVTIRRPWHRRLKPVRPSVDSCAQYIKANKPQRSPSHQPELQPQDGGDEGERTRKREEIRRGKQKAEEQREEPPLMDDDMEEWEEKGSGEEENDEREEDEEDNGLSDEERRLMEILRGMQHRGTRFPDEETIRELGFEQDIRFLFNELGLRRLMNLHTESFKEETCQFIATLQLHFYPDGEVSEDGSVGHISFFCRDARYTLSMRQLDELFDFPKSNGSAVEVDKIEQHQVWKAIASGVYSSSSSKASKIRNPVLRFFHKCLANTLFARKTTGNINDSELALLDIALSKTPYRLKGKERLKGDQNNAGITPLLLDQLMSYKSWAWTSFKKGSQSELRMGGLVTPILVACDINLDMSPSNIAPSESIDLANLRNSCFLARSRHEGAHVYQFDHPELGSSRMTLPRPGYTVILGGFNIDFCPPAGTLIGQTNRRHGNVQEPPQEPPREQPQPAEETAARAQREHSPDEFESYHFEEYQSSKKMAEALDTAHKHIGILQKWNKFQDKIIRTMRKQIRTINEKMSCSTSRSDRPDIGFDRARHQHPSQPRQHQARTSPQWDYHYPAAGQQYPGPAYHSDPYLGLGGIPDPPPPVIREYTPDLVEEPAEEPIEQPEKARASSYEPREKKQKRIGYERPRSSTSRIGSDRPVRLVRKPIRATNPASSSIDPNSTTPSYTREDMEKATDAFFSQP